MFGRTARSAPKPSVSPPEVESREEEEPFSNKPNS